MRRTLLILLVLAGCSSRTPHGLWTDPEFEAADLSDGVVIGGIVDLTADRDLFDLQRDAELLEQVFAAERPGVDVASWSEGRAVMEPDTLDAILGSYRRTGRLSADQLAALRPLVHHGRFLALSRIDLDQTTWDYPRRVRETGDRTVVDVEPESRRRVSLLFDLYDLERSRLAFTIPIERTGIEHGSTYTVEGVDATPTETEVRDAIHDLDHPGERPPPADRDLLLRGMLREAIGHLP